MFRGAIILILGFKSGSKDFAWLVRGRHYGIYSIISLKMYKQGARCLYDLGCRRTIFAIEARKSVFG
ncbi:hypothetical protein FUAX_35450 [Fulvitalea axinellae]|uniref:Uncharacterized protein n=1 Tax=Fulvitalea axinellae TaxID=1182444 RepID=A0AAU9CLN2_9BACT|nr:hypothetical protein FUAX_35450 [Fulvitalea axinellae]